MSRAQAYGAAVSGSHVYVTGFDSDSLAVIDVSNPASPSITGNVSSATVMNMVRCGFACPANPPVPQDPSDVAGPPLFALAGI